VTWETARRLLAVRLDALGDVLMTTPALRALKAGPPGRDLTLLTSPAGAAAAALIPEVDAVLVYEAPWMKATPPRAVSTPDLTMLERLRAERFDAAVVFTVYSQNPLPAALLCYLADIPRRLAHCHARGLDRRPWVLLHPGATASSRRYPPDHFAEAARALAQATGCAVVLTGTDDEQALLDTMAAMIGVDAVALTGLPLADFAALVEAAPLLVSNNSGPVHVAAAVGTAVVDLYALTNPQHTPWDVPHRVLFHDVPCKYCYKSVCPAGHHDCLRRVPPKAVAEAALALLPSDWPGERGSR
jgi:ADP-heptose:LPS heptosyltransferase